MPNTLSIVCLILFMGMTQFTAAQHPILAGYSGRQVGEEVRIDFGIKGGASCNGVTLYRTLDDGATYSFVAEIEGVCGGSEFTEFYNLSDASPARNRRNAYRLQLGNQGYSDTLSVLYIPQTSEVLAFPMPFTETLHLQWDAATGEEWLLRIYTLDGRLVVRDIAVRAPRVELPLHELPSGTYVLQLRHPVRGEVLQKRAVKSTFEP